MGRVVGQEVADVTQRDIAATLGRFEPAARVEADRIDVGDGRGSRSASRRLVIGKAGAMTVAAQVPRGSARAGSKPDRRAQRIRCTNGTSSSRPAPWQIAQDSPPEALVFASMWATLTAESWHELQAAFQARVGRD